MRFRFPRVSPLPSTRALSVGIDDGAFWKIRFGIELLKLCIGRGGLRQMNEGVVYLFCFHDSSRDNKGSRFILGIFLIASV